MSGFRAFRFRFPDLDPGRVRPWGMSTHQPTGGLMVDGDETVRQAIRMLLATRPGERVMRPTYGCDLHKLAFAPNDDTTAGLAVHYVTRALTRWEPRVELLRVDAWAGRPSEEHQAGASEGRASGLLSVVVEYRIRRTRQADRVLFTVDLTGPSS